MQEIIRSIPVSPESLTRFASTHASGRPQRLAVAACPQSGFCEVPYRFSLYALDVAGIHPLLNSLSALELAALGDLCHETLAHTVDPEERRHFPKVA